MFYFWLLNAIERDRLHNLDYFLDKIRGRKEKEKEKDKEKDKDKDKRIKEGKEGDDDSDSDVDISRSENSLNIRTAAGITNYDLLLSMKNPLANKLIEILLFIGLDPTSISEHHSSKMMSE